MQVPDERREQQPEQPRRLREADHAPRAPARCSISARCQGRVTSQLPNAMSLRAAKRRSLCTRAACAASANAAASAPASLVTWSPVSKLTEGQNWHQSACNVLYERGCVYLVMERRVTRNIDTWAVGELAPVLMRAKVGDDLTRRESWTFASELSFSETIPGLAEDPAIDFFGVPFYPAAYPKGFLPAPRRNSAPIGWLETNVVQIQDPDHVWFDPAGRTFHLWGRAHTGGTGYAAVAKVVEAEDGSMTTTLERVPSGKRALFVPCPGGQMRFHVLYDGPSKRFWLLSSQATDSMTRADRLPDDRYNLPNNERHRLQLHFSKNMIDWCFAGLVAAGATPRESRHYASMTVDGDDLCVLSRSGDARAKSAHDGNLITFHRVKDFRSLVY